MAAIRSRLPEQIEDPTIVRFDVAALPIMTFAVGSSQRSDVTRRQIEDDLKPLLEQIDGVAAVEVNGGEVREIQVDLDPGRLEALGIPVAVVAEKLAADNLDLPGGQMQRPGQTIALRTKGEFETVDEIEQVILRSDGGSTVRIRDVGRVVDGFEERTSTTRLNGADAVSFSIKKQSGANTAAIAERVHATIDRLRPNFPALNINTVHDDAEFIRENVKQVREAIVFGALMAVLVIFVFMRDWRSTLITALALPTSVVSTFFFMWIAGFTINMMTLMALSLVIGILIDDAVVVRENIFRHMEHGEDAMTAARRGTAEIGLAVMATTFTILAVFLPVGFMTGIVGQFFKSFALTIAFAVAMSLLVAFTLDPMLSSRFVRFIPPEERTRTRAGRLFERMGRAYDKLDHGYHRVLAVALRNPWKTLAVAATVFVVSLSATTVMGTEFVPVEDRGEFQVIVELPPGTSFDESVATTARVEREVLAIPEVTQVFSTVGVNGQVRASNLRVKTTKKDSPRARDRRDQGAGPHDARRDSVRRRQGGRPGVHAGRAVRAADQRLRAWRRSADAAARRERDPGEGAAAAGRGGHQQQPGQRPAGSGGTHQPFTGRRPRIQRRQHRLAAARDGRRHRADAAAGRRPRARHPGQAGSGVSATTPTRCCRRRSIRRAAPRSARATWSQFAPAVGPSNIDREQRRKQAKIGIDLAPGYALGDVTAEVEKVVASVQMPATFEWGFAGDVELMQESAAAMGLAMILAVAFIYIVLATQFESFLQPFIIMLSLPLALVGALLLLLATGKNLGMPAMIGVVMLMGLVTKNAILLVDYTNQLRREGLSLKDALLKAGPVRLRPIVMTTVAMILGMLPSAVGTGDGSEFRAPISIATIGGLMTSTLLTLVVVPVAYLLLEGAVARVRAWRQQPMPAGLRTAARVAGVLILLALMGAFLSVASAFAQGTGTGDSGIRRGRSPSTGRSRSR